MAGDVNVKITADDQASGAFRAISAEALKFGSIIGASIVATEKFLDLATKATIGGLKTAVQEADKLHDLSQKLGMGVQQLSAYKLAAEQSGTSLEGIARGVKSLSMQMVKHGDAFKKMGIDTNDADRAFRQLADVFAVMPDGMEKAALATKLFGKSGMELIPTLNLGSQGLEESARKAAQYGKTMAMLAPQADQLMDTMTEFSLVGQAAYANLALAVVPSLTEITAAMADAAREGGVLEAVLVGLGAAATEALGPNFKKGLDLAGGDVFKAMDLFGGVSPFRDVDEHVVHFRGEVEELQRQLVELKANPFTMQFRLDGAIEQLDKAKLRLEYFESWQSRNVMQAASKLGDYRDARDRSGEAAPVVERMQREAAAAARTKELFAALKAQAKDGASDYDALVKSLTAKTAAQDADASSIAKLNPAQRDYAQWLARVTAGVEKLTPAEMAKAAALWDGYLAAAKAADATEALRKADDEWAKGVEKAEEAADKHLQTLAERTRAAEDELANYGKTKSEIEATTIARLEEQLAMVDGFDSQEELAKKLREEIALRKQYQSATAGRETVEAADKAAKDAQESWMRTAEQIGQSLSDEIMRGGRSAGEMLEALARTWVLKPSLQVAGTGFAGGTMNAIAAGLGSFGQPNGAFNLTSLLSGITGASGLASGVLAAGQFLGSAGLANFGAGMYAGATGGFSAAGAIGANAGATSAAGLGSTLGAAMPYIGAAMLAYSLLAKKSTPHIGGMAEYSAADGLATGKIAGFYDTRSGFGGNKAATDSQAIGIASQTAQAITGLLDGVSKAFGGTGNFRTSTGFADDSSSDGAWGALRIMQGDQKVLDWGDTRTSRWAAREFADGQKGVEQYNAELAKSVRAVLDGMDLPAWADNILAALGNTPSLDKLGAAVDTIGRLKPVAERLTELGVAAEDITLTAIEAAGGIDGLAATLDALPDLSDQAQAAFDAAGLASLSAASAFAHWSDQARELAGSFDGSLASAQALGTAMQNRYQAELQLIQQVQSLIDSVHVNAADQADRFRLDTLDDAGRYDFYDQRMSAALDLIRTATDPQIIQQYAQRYLADQAAAWGLLSADQRTTHLAEFQGDAMQLDTLVGSRGAAITEQIRADNQAQAEAIGAAVRDGIKEYFAGAQAAADTQQQAADTQLAAARTPLQLTVRVDRQGNVAGAEVTPLRP